MKKLAAGFLAITLIFSASLCWAAYVIHLKDGRNITTHEYWDEGDQIKIKQYGGVVGIAKDDVVSIEETDDVRSVVVKSAPEKEKKEETETAESPAEKKGEGKQNQKQGGEAAKKEKMPDQPAQKKPAKEKNAFEKELDSLKKRFEKVESMTKEELYQFDKDLLGLRNKILRAGLGGVYADQIVELMEMNHKAEEIYKQKKKKNQ
jgi:G3E family GTPase